MKVLHNTAAYIKGKLYKEGSPIPKEYEKEFEQFLVETEIRYPNVDPLRQVKDEASETIKSVETKPAQISYKDSNKKNNKKSKEI